MPALPLVQAQGHAERAEVAFNPSLLVNFLHFLSVLFLCSLQLLTKILAHNNLYPGPNTPRGYFCRDSFWDEMIGHRSNTSGLGERIWEGDVLRGCH